MYTIRINEDSTLIDHGTFTLLEIKQGAQNQVDYSLSDCQQHTFYLNKGMSFGFEPEALRQQLVPGSTYHVTGSLLNYTKKNPPELVLCLTSAVLITVPDLVAQP